ncbi:lytic murein transglycosylase [Chthonobacter rhizosphaerae]|uniref:lytic murein transglycosylase n=1 Tax=Chthonobacter rhizosphaerae TaxID=2735553 RepID=UPI001FE650CA|nr:lytic murein transglycosylase [Chthonobacter rhizosphaerae]
MGPMTRFRIPLPDLFLARVVAVAIALSAAPAPAAAQSRAATEAAFQRWLADTVTPAARRAGVSDATIAEATTGLTPDWSLPDLAPPGSPPPRGPSYQAEFSSPGRYLDAKRLAGLTSAGRARLKTHRAVLAAAEKRYGVPAEIIVAIWGRESDFGRVPLKHSAIRVLATQAFMGARKAMFLEELVAALKVVDEDHLPLADIRSSWAGALGQPQFMPTKMLSHAVDFDGDGRRDIWTSTADTLGSIGHYLQDFGWLPGVRWGVEVTLPETVPCTLEGPDKGRPLADFAGAGVTLADGRPLSADALGRGNPDAHLLMPAGRKGPAFLVSKNFYVLKRYNESDLYAIFIGHLGDRLRADTAIRGRWAEVSGFTRGDVRDLQKRLIAAGYDVGGADGLVGWQTRTAIGALEAAEGRAPTCYPHKALFGR